MPYNHRFFERKQMLIMFASFYILMSLCTCYCIFLGIRRLLWKEEEEAPIAALPSRFTCEVCGEPAGTSPFLCPDHAMEREREEWDGPPQI